MIFDDFAIFTTGLVMLIPMRTLVRVASFVFSCVLKRLTFS